MRIALILPDLGGGGAERLSIDLAAGFVQRGAEVDLVLMAEQGEFLPMVPEGVRIVDLAAPRLRHAWRPLRRYLGRERPDAVLAAMWPLTSVTVLAAAGLASQPRVIVADHCPLIEQYAGSALTLAAMRASVLATYRCADAIVGVSTGLAGELADLAGLHGDRAVAVPNPIPAPLRSAHGAATWTAPPGARILSVGKLKDAKNYALLIDAFARLNVPGAELAIVGEGAERAGLEARIARLGLDGRVTLPGFTATPGDWYASADLFVLSSDYEGFGNVLVEAMHCGLPVVSTDCPFGPAEILGQGRWGRLVPPGDATALAQAMIAALADSRDPAGQRARAAEFSVDRAGDAYWRLLVP